MKKPKQKTVCDKGHYYDAGQYATCPHCEKLKKRDAEVVEQAPPFAYPDKEPESHPGVYLQPEDIQGIKKIGNKHPVEQVDDMNPTRSMLNVPVFDSPNSSERPVESMPQETPMQTWQEKTQTELPAFPTQDTTLDEFDHATSMKEAQASTGASADMRTTTIYDVGETQPVVGWLVGIGGTCLGQSFVLKSGRNQIGRHPSMDVVLAGDRLVSRICHCIITFEPHRQIFYLQPGESSGLTYCNEEAVLIPQELHKKDIVKIGSSALLFVPLCDGEFRWETYLRGDSV